MERHNGTAKTLRTQRCRKASQSESGISLHGRSTTSCIGLGRIHAFILKHEDHEEHKDRRQRDPACSSVPHAIFHLSTEIGRNSLSCSFKDPCELRPRILLDDSAGRTNLTHGVVGHSRAENPLSIAMLCDVLRGLRALRVSNRPRNDHRRCTESLTPPEPKFHF